MVSNFFNFAGNSISLFPLESVTTKDFGWLHPTSWSQKDGNFWAQRRSSYPHTVLRPPPRSRLRSKRVSYSEGNWILKAGDEYLGWAQAQSFQSAFAKTFLFYEANTAMMPTQLSLLISAIVTVSDSDVVFIAGLNSLAHSMLPGTGTWSTWWLPNNHMHRASDPIGFEWQALKITASDWWALEQSQKDRLTLAYLIKRHEFKKEQLRKEFSTKKRPRYRGLLNLFNPWRR